MAKIALAASMVLGIVAPFTGPALPFVEAASIGLAVGGALLERKTGIAPLQDLQVSSSAEGTPIPFGYGLMRLAGQVIWSPGIDFKLLTGQQSKAWYALVNTNPKTSTYGYNASFAAAFCEGPAIIQRIWADSKLIYNNGQPFGSFAPWDPDTAYQLDDLASYQWNPGTGYITEIFQCALANTNVAPPGNSLYWSLSGYAFWDSSIQYFPGNLVAFPGLLSEPAQSGAIYGCILPSINDDPPSSPKHWQELSAYYAAPTIYLGDSAQDPDPLIQGLEGVDQTPACRGICYCVWENFPLGNFGNRIPNLRAEVQFLTYETVFSPPESWQTTVPAQPYGTIPADVSEEFIANCGIPQANVGSAGVTRFDNPGVIYPSLCTVSSAWLGLSGVQLPTNLDAITEVVALAGASLSTTDNGQGNVYWTSTGAALFAGASAPSGWADGLPGTVTTETTGSGWTSTSVVVIWEGAAGTFDPSVLDGCYLLCSANQTEPVSGQTGVSISLEVQFTMNQPPGWGTQFVPLTTIAEMILDLCERAGLAPSLVDVSQLTATAIQPVSGPYGYVIERPTRAAAAIQEIMKAFFIDACESSGVLKFVPRATYLPGTPLALPETDLGLAADNSELVEQLAQEQDLPQSVTVVFNDYEINYQQGKQLKARNPRIITLETKNGVILSLPFSLTADQARQIAEVALYSAWQERTVYSFNLWRAFYLLYDPTDLVDMVYEGNTYQVRLTSANLGQSGAVAAEAVLTDLNTYTSSVAGAASLGFNPTAPRVLGVTLLWLLDIPLLRDVDANPSGTGFYAALGSATATWGGAVLYQSSDDSNFSELDTAPSACSFGVTTTALAAPSTPWTWDTVNTLTIQMSGGAGVATLAGDTDLNVLNGSNALIVGEEVIQFADAVENMDGTYTVSRLLRGRRGTEGACGSHAFGESVIAPLAGGFLRQGEPLANIGLEMYYRAVTNGQNIATVQSDDFTLAGNDLMPYAPVGIGGFLDAQGNIVITWVRRTRIGGEWLDGIGTVAVSEEEELYDVDILKSGAVVRTFASLPTPTLLYLLADQITDFGSAPASVIANVYQDSAAVGRGFPGTGVAPSPGGWPVPWPEDLPITSTQLYLVNGS